MVWKIGLGILLAGVALSLGGCVLIGTAVSKAGSAREIANQPFQPGGAIRLAGLEVDPSQPVRMRIEAELEVPQEVLDRAVEQAQIVPFQAPINYRVEDGAGETVHLGAGTLQASEIVPHRDGPHYDSYDRRVTISHESQRFDPPASGRIAVSIELPDRANHDAPLIGAALRLYDQAPNPGGWAATGALSVLLGPALALLGLLVWIVGLIVRPKRRSVATVL